MNTKQKTIVFLFLFIFSAFTAASFLSARGSRAAGNSLTVYSIRGPSGIGLIKLFESPPSINGFDIRAEALSQADLIAARFVAGEAMVGILPPVSAARIASSGRNIQIAAVIGAGMLSLISSDASIQTIADLKGKAVEVAGQGATPDFVFRRILDFHGLDPEMDLDLGYSLAYPEIAQSLIAGRISTALLPEPFATMAFNGNPGLRQISDIQQEWVRAGGNGNYPMTVLVTDGAFAASNPEVLDGILNAVKASIEWVISDPAGAGELVEKHDLGLRADIAEAAIPKSNYVFIPAAEARPSLEAFFRVVLENDPAFIGGVLPGDEFYLAR